MSVCRNSNRKTYYKGLHYYRNEIKDVPKGKIALRISWKFLSNMKTIYEEKLVYEAKNLIAWMGGSLSIFVGMSIFDILNQIVDLGFYFLYRRSKKRQRKSRRLPVSKKDVKESKKPSRVINILRLSFILS